MIAKKIKLVNFRNYEDQIIELSSGVNVFYGKNAQGKTNVLEAVGLFAGLKSYRGAKDSELINFDADFSHISLEFESHEREHFSEIFLERGKKKKIKVNGVGKRSLSSLAEFFGVIMFSPDDLNMIKGSPQDRRRMMDTSISSLKPAYAGILNDYNKILENKNKLLKSENPDNDMIMLWNERLSDVGARIISYRKSFLDVLTPVIKKFHSKIAEGEEIDVFYKTAETDISDEKSIKSFLLSKMKKNIEKEKDAGFSLYGPHKDDVEFFINGKDVKMFGSQGQQRTVVLGIMLSRIELEKQIKGEYPVLLLDDVLSELDSFRQSFLLEKIKNHQVLITSTECDSLFKSEENKFFKVEKGRIV